MFKSLDIQKDMEVVGMDGKHVGTVNHLETANRIILSKDDPRKRGAATPHFDRPCGCVRQRKQAGLRRLGTATPKN